MDNKATTTKMSCKVAASAAFAAGILLIAMK